MPQYRLTFLFLIFSMVNAYVAYTPVLFLYTPDHWCCGEQGAAEGRPIIPARLQQNETVATVEPLFLAEELGRDRISQCYSKEFRQTEVKEQQISKQDLDVQRVASTVLYL